MLTDDTLSTPANTFALLRRTCGPRSNVMEASGTDGDTFTLGCAGRVSVVCARAGMALTLISAVPIILGVAAWSEALELVHVTAVLTGLLMGLPPPNSSISATSWKDSVLRHCLARNESYYQWVLVS